MACSWKRETWDAKKHSRQTRSCTNTALLTLRARIAEYPWLLEGQRIVENLPSRLWESEGSREVWKGMPEVAMFACAVLQLHTCSRYRRHANPCTHLLLKWGQKIKSCWIHHIANVQETEPGNAPHKKRRKGVFKHIFRHRQVVCRHFQDILITMHVCAQWKP